MSDPNTFDKELQDAKANLDNPENKGTEGKDNPLNPLDDANKPVDYQKKFSESSKEAQRLYEENKAKDAEIERLRLLSEKGTNHASGESMDILYPGFEQLDPEAQANLINYTNSITKRAKEEILKDPAISFSRNVYNEKRWNDAFEVVSSKFPELKADKEAFKAKYFKPGVEVPNNIENILEDVSKIHLFDKAKDIGIREEKEKADRIDLERVTGGDKQPKASRSLEDWQRMAQENPAEFAKNSKQYHADMASGKI